MCVIYSTQIRLLLRLLIAPSQHCLSPLYCHRYPLQNRRHFAHRKDEPDDSSATALSAGPAGDIYLLRQLLLPRLWGSVDAEGMAKSTPRICTGFNNAGEDVRLSSVDTGFSQHLASTGLLSASAAASAASAPVFFPFASSPALAASLLSSVQMCDNVLFLLHHHLNDRHNRSVLYQLVQSMRGMEAHRLHACTHTLSLTLHAACTPCACTACCTMLCFVIAVVCYAI